MSRSRLEALPRRLRTLAPSPAVREPIWRRLLSSPASRQSFHASSGAQRSAAGRLPSPAGWQHAFTPNMALRQQPARRGFRFTSWRRSASSAGEAQESLSLSARFKKLTREYGRAAVGVYFLLSILDMPFFFMLVKSVGTERIAYIEHQVLSTISSIIPDPILDSVSRAWSAVRNIFKSEKAGQAPVEGWGVEEAQERVNDKASLATQLALAYAIHKSFFFVRIPLTIAVTPRIVKQLRAWGWNIGRKLVKSKAPR